DATPTVSTRHEETPPVSSDVSAVSHTALERLIDVLQRELDEARLRLREAHARETQWLQMLSQMQQQNQRLLDMPRTPPPSPHDAPGRVQPPRRVPQPPGLRGSQERRKGPRGVRGPGVSWSCCRSIPQASRIRTCSACSVSTKTFRIPSPACCAIGWCSGSSEGAMWLPSHRDMTEQEGNMNIFVGNLNWSTTEEE